MKKGVLKFTAYCMAGTIALAGSGTTAMAAGEMPLAGIGARLAVCQEKKEATGVVQVQATGYDVTAIAQVNEYVNIRDEASAETGQVVGKLYNNSAAEILGKSGDWYLIKSGNVTGYVKIEFFVTGEKAQELASEVGTEVATVNTETLMVRADASTDAEVLALVGDSEELQVVEDNGDWVKVAVDSDVVGYVAKEYVECETQFVQAESIETSNAREEAVQNALERAEQMNQAAIAAMNSADADEAAYAAYMAVEAAAEAKQLAAEQLLDYSLQDIATSAVNLADEAEYAAYMAEQYEAAEEAAAAAEAEAAAQAAAQQTEAGSGTTPETTAPAQTEAPSTDNGGSTDNGNTDTADSPSTDAPTGSESVGDAPASSSNSSLRQSVVNYALQFVGNPYVYGGNSLTNGIDCSGFTQQILGHFGVSLPRTAAAQSGCGTPVSMDNLQPGDLLFYSSGGGIGHVTMYIGNGQVVHASNSRTGIIVSSVNYRTPCSARSFL